MTIPDIHQRLQQIRTRMGAAAEACGRNAADIDLIAVSKKQSEESILAAMDAGQKIFGENRVQEAKQKFSGLRECRDFTLHLIGPLQTNKVDEAVKLFDVIETLDRPSLAEALAKAIKKLGRTPKLYIEVNSGAEPQKAGMAPDQLAGFLDFCRDQCRLSISGLMCIPPQSEDAEMHFRIIKTLADQFALPNISMGMSGDFEAAIRCGATAVRIGTAVFGQR